VSGVSGLDKLRPVMNNIHMAVAVTDHDLLSTLIAHHSDDPCGELDLYLDDLDSFGIFDGVHERSCGGGTCKAVIIRYGQTAVLPKVAPIYE